MAINYCYGIYFNYIYIVQCESPYLYFYFYFLLCKIKKQILQNLKACKSMISTVLVIIVVNENFELVPDIRVVDKSHSRSYASGFTLQS